MKNLGWHVFNFLQEVTLVGVLGTLLEHSLVGESKANSRAERACGVLLRIHTFSLETRIGEKISAQHSVSFFFFRLSA